MYYLKKIIMAWLKSILCDLNKCEQRKSSMHQSNGRHVLMGAVCCGKHIAAELALFQGQEKGSGYHISSL
jgi:hypothetical protein